MKTSLLLGFGFLSLLFIAAPSASAQCEFDPLWAGATDARFGASIDAADGLVLIGSSSADAGSIQSGAASIFERSLASGWVMDVGAFPFPPASMAAQRGAAVGIDGDLCAVGVPRADDLGVDSGRVEIYRRWSPSSSTLVGVVLPQDGHAGHLFGSAVALQEDVLLVTARGDGDSGTNAGAVYVFRIGGATQQQVEKLTPPAPAAEDTFGCSIDLGADIAVIGAPRDDDAGDNAGAAYIYRGGATGFALEDKLLPAAAGAQSFTGASVSISQGRALLGAHGAEAAGVHGAGRAVLFEETAGVWSETQQFNNPAPSPDDGFGYSVALHGEHAAFASRGDSGNPSAHGRVWWAEQAFFGWTTLEDVTPASMASPGNVNATVALDGTDLFVSSPNLPPGGAVFPISLRRFPRNCDRVMHSLDESATWTASGGQATLMSRDVGRVGSLHGFGVTVAEVVDFSVDAYASYQSDATFCAANFPSSVSFPHTATGAMNVALMSFGTYPGCSWWMCPNVVALWETPITIDVTQLACDGWSLSRGINATLEVSDFGGLLSTHWTLRDMEILAVCYVDTLDFSLTRPFVSDPSVPYYLTGSLDLQMRLDVRADFFPRDLPPSRQASFCPSNPNSSSRPAEIYAGGSPSVVDNQLYLSVVDLPPSAYGLPVMSNQLGFVGLFGGSQGNLCLGGTIYRFGTNLSQASPAGELGFRVDLGQLPQGQTVGSGQTVYFQYWYRDWNPQLTSNTSNGLAITFE